MHVLIISDNDSDLKWVNAPLTATGLSVNVIYAYTMKEATSLMGSVKFDLVLYDLAFSEKRMSDNFKELADTGIKIPLVVLTDVFGDPAAKVRVIGKPRREIRVNQVPGQPEADDLRAQTHHVHIVVLHGLMGAVPVVQDGGANASDLVGGDRRADAGAANHDPTVGRAGQDLAGQRASDVGKVDGVGIE